MRILALTVALSVATFGQTKPTGLQTSSVTSTSVKLSWTTSSGDKYEVQLPAGTTVRTSVASNDLPITVSGLAPGTSYSWRVRASAKGQNPASDWTDGEAFTTLPAPPTSPSPLPATNVTTSSATLNWTSVAGATAYDWELYTSDFVTRLSAGSTAGTSADVSGLSAATTYKWRISARNSAGSSSWVSSSITTPMPAPATPGNLSATPTTSGATLSWGAVSGATSYNVEVYTSSSLTTRVANTSSTSNSTTVSGLAGGTQYWWRVQASNAGGLSGWSISSFTTLVPVPSTPSGLTSTPTATGASLTWGSVSGATSYVVEVHDKSNYRSLVMSASPTANSTTVSGLQGGTTYYWQVKAVNAGGESGWAQGSFTTTTAAPSAPSGLGATPTTTGASLGWAAVTGATSYVVEVHDKSNYRSLVTSTSPTSSSATVSGLHGGTTYYWQVKAVNGGGESGWAQGSFTTTTAAPSTPTGLSATPTTTGALLSWGNVSGATSYVVEVHDKSNYRSLVTSTSPTSSSATVSGLQGGTTYYWRVKAVNAGGESEWAQESFQTSAAPQPPSPPTVTVAPAINSVLVTFSSVTGATSYDVQILDKQNNGNVVGRGSTTNASTPVTVSGLQGGTKYYYSATVTVGGQTSTPTTGNFTTNAAPQPPSPPTVTVVPVINSVTITFSAVTGATSYDVQILDKQNNGNVVGSGLTANASTPVIVSGLQGGTKYYYSATVTVGGQTSSPTAGNFTTNAAPQPPSPPTVIVAFAINSVSFTFTSVTGATSYSVKVLDKKNNGNVVGSGSTTDPSKAVTITGLQGSSKYYYEATVTVSGLTSDPATGDFTTNAAPQPPSPPTVTATPAISSVSFAFGPVTGATSYGAKVLDKKNNGNVIGEGSTSNASQPVVVSGLQGSTKYYYEATVTVSGLTSDPATGDFTTTAAPRPPSPPTVTATPGISSVSFVFSAVTGTTTYSVKVLDKKNNGNVVGSGSTNDPSRAVTITGLQGSTKYYYEATVIVSGLASDPATGDFTTNDGSSGTLAAPTNLQVSSTTSTSASLSWDGPGQGAKFELKVSPGNLDDNNAKSPYDLKSLSPKTAYTWQVRTVKGGDSSAWVSGPSFTTLDASAGTLTAPSNLQVANITSAAASLSWDGPGQGAKFEVKVLPGNISDGNAKSPYDLKALSPKTAYTWQVRTVKGSDSSAWVSGPSFTTLDASAGTLAAPTSLLVANITSASASLSWDGPGQGAKFELKVSPGNIRDVNANSPYALSSLSPKTAYTWQARTVKNNDSSAWVSGPSFTTLDASAGTLVAPSNLQVANITSASASLSWDGPGQGAKFELKVSPGNIREVNANSPYALSSLSPKTAYTWQIRTVKNNDSSGWVSGPAFTTLDFPAGTLVAPSNLQVTNITSASASLTWDGAGPGSKFELKVSPGNIRDVNANSPYTLSALSPKIAYTWQIRTVKGSDSSVWVSGPSFSTLDASAGTLVAPSNLQVTNITSVSASLTWDGPGQGAKFELKVSPGNIRDVNANSPYALSSLSPKTAYTWQVRTVKNNDSSAWVSGLSFTTLDASAGTLVAPSNLQVTNITSVSASLTWDGPGQGAKFELKASPGNIKDANANPPYALSSLSPKTAYTWQIRTVKNNDSSAWVAGPSFTTLDASTLPLAPSVSVTQTANSATFSFVAVTGATSYDVQVLNKQGGGTVAGSASTADPSRSVVVSGLDPKTKYDYEATVTVSGQTSHAATGSFTTLPSKPKVTHAVGPNSVTFTFTSVDGATSYDVIVLDNPVGGVVVGRGSTTDPNKSVTVNGLRNRTQYYFEATVTVAGQTSNPETGSFMTDDVASAVERFDSAIPDQYRLSQNYPNPFNPTTTIQFSIPSSSNVRITVYNALGNLVHILVNGRYAPGRYTASWDASSLPTGVYFYRLQAGTFVETKRLVLLK